MEYCQCKRRDTRLTRQYRLNGYYCHRCKAILNPDPQAPQYQQTSPSEPQSPAHSPVAHHSQTPPDSRQSTPSPGPLERTQFQHSINSALDLISISTNLRELGDNISISYSNNSDSEGDNHQNHNNTVERRTHSPDISQEHEHISISVDNSLENTLTNLNQATQTNERTQTQNHTQENDHQRVQTEENEVAQHSEEEVSCSEHDYEELETDEEFLTPGKDFFRNQSIHQGHTDVSNDNPDNDLFTAHHQEATYTELTPDTHTPVVPTHDATPTDHRRRLFQPDENTSADNRTSSTLHTVDNWILPPSGQIQTIAQVHSTHTKRTLTQQHPDQTCPPSTQRTPAKTNKTAIRGENQTRTPGSIVSNIFTTPSRILPNPRDISQRPPPPAIHIEPTAHHTSRTQQRSSSPIHATHNLALPHF